MVSTRSIKYKFSENEKVLCYEPDPTKAKVLYDSKVLQVVESKDKRGRRIIEYLIHFQGWNPSWDRRVREDFVLKDTEENRQLQRDLAEKSQLQLGAYLYRKERKKRTRNLSGGNNDTKVRISRTLSDDGSSCSREDNEYSVNEDGESESYSSSVESTNEDDRIVFRLGHKLKGFLEYDYNMIHTNNKILDLPAKIPVVTILKDFVKQFAIRIVCYPKEENQITGSVKRQRRSSQFMNNKNNQQSKLEDALINIDLCKEVADGLRIYFDFTLREYLLYNNEKEQSEILLSEEYLKNFKYKPSDELSISIKQDYACLASSASQGSEVGSESQPSLLGGDVESERCKRRLRSYNKIDELECSEANSLKQDNCVSSIASTSSESSAPQAGNSLHPNMFKTRLPLNIGIPTEGREVLQKILKWEILPEDTCTEASMIYGAIHLARLVLKLPDFLNASTISDEKLKILLKHLDAFIEFLEEHGEWFGEHNYCEKVLNE